MKFTTVLATLCFTSVALATVPATFDQHYDDAGASTNIVACSNLTPQFPTLGSFPSFPNIGGASAIAGFGSANCGTCWELTDGDTGVSINVTAIDHAGDGFNLSLEALNTLTDGQAVAKGSAQVTAVQVDSSACGL